MRSMPEERRELITHVIERLIWATGQIRHRFSTISEVNDFLDTDEGIEKLDSICMQLINIGEALKQVDKLSDKRLLSHYPAIEWKSVMGMRDIVTHHYFDIDAEIVFNVCEEHIPKLEETLIQIKNDLSGE
jgi:uncharacterized protein with HEPN domain